MQKIRAPMLVAVATIVGATAAVAQEPGSLNSPVRSQEPTVFNSDEVLSHLAPAIWEGENLAYTEEAPTIHPAQTAYARMMPRTIQEIVEGRLYHAFGFQLASTLIAVGDDGLILIDRLGRRQRP